MSVEPPVPPGGGTVPMQAQNETNIETSGIQTCDSNNGRIFTGDASASVISSESLIVDGLICSIARVLSRDNNDSVLVDIIANDVLEQEIKDSWCKLFTYFKTVLEIDVFLIKS